MCVLSIRLWFCSQFSSFVTKSLSSHKTLNTHIGHHVTEIFERICANKSAISSKEANTEKQVLNLSFSIHDFCLYQPQVGCDISLSDEEVVDCMRKIDGEVLIKKQWSVDPIGPMISSVFRPTIDGQFIAKSPDELLHAGNFQNKDILTGAVRNEGSVFLPYLFPSVFPVTKPKIELSEDVYRSVIRNMSVLKASNDFVVNSVAFEYARPCDDEDGAGWTSDYTAALDQLLGDAIFVCPVVNFARKYATNVRYCA